MESTFEFLRFVQSKDLSFWDVKRLSFSFSNLSKTYSSVRLENILTPIKNKIKKDEYNGKLPIISKISFNDGKIHLRDDFKTGMDLYSLSLNDLLISNINFHQGATAINKIGDVVCSTHYQPYRIDFFKVIPEYLILVLRNKIFLEYVSQQKTNGIKTESNYNFIKNLEIPLPSIEKQKELVAQYDALLNVARDKENQADTKEQSIDDYLMAELGIKENLPSTSNSLFQIGEYKVLSNWDIKTLEKNQNFLSSSKYSTYKCSQILSINPSTVLPSDKNTEISFIPMENVSDAYGKVMRLDKKNVTMAKGYTKFKNGDLIWAKITPCMQNGKSAVVDNLLNGYGCGSTEFYVIRNDKITEKLNTNFLHLLLRMKLVLNEAMKTFTGACGQQRVPVGFIKELQIPLPPLSIQHRILEEVTFRKEQVKSLREESEKLRLQAISDFEKEVFN